MELKDTIKLMQSDDYKERFRAEYYQLKIRCGKLAETLEKYRTNTLPFVLKCSYEGLVVQLAYMELYLNTLENRANVENIEL